MDKLAIKQKVIGEIMDYLDGLIAEDMMPKEEPKMASVEIEVEKAPEEAMDYAEAGEEAQMDDEAPEMLAMAEEEPEEEEEDDGGEFGFAKRRIMGS